MLSDALKKSIFALTQNAVMKNFLLAPSILAANFGQLDAEIELINSSKADWLHVDVMDGVFVPNISFGQMLVKSMHKTSKLPLDVHLMIVEPEKYIDAFIDCGASSVSFHYEATNHAHRILQQIKNRDVKAGIAINPHTPVEHLFDILEDVDLVCMMSVNPGFGGQKFIYRSLDKIRRLKDQIIERNLNTLIEVDGGVGLHNAEAILKAGADVLVAGSSVFKSENPLQTIERFKSLHVNNFDL